MEDIIHIVELEVNIIILILLKVFLYTNVLQSI